MAEATHVHDTSPSPSIRPILRAKSNSTLSTASSESKASGITFAPLPSIEARTRRNGQRIGLSSRAELLRRTRRQFDDDDTYPSNEGHHYIPPPEDDEIPLPDFGKLVKGLWRSMSRTGREKNLQDATRTVQTTTISEAVTTTPEAEHEHEEGGVWMEEVTWGKSEHSSPPAPKSSSADDNIPKRKTRRDTVCTVDSGSFLVESDGKTEPSDGQRRVGTQHEGRGIDKETSPRFIQPTAVT